MGAAAPELMTAPENPSRVGETFVANARFGAAMARILAVTGLKTQVELANLLGIRQSSISDAKRRQSIPDGWLVKMVELFGCSPIWIKTGEGAAFLVGDPDRTAPAGLSAQEPVAPPAPPEPTVGEMLRALSVKVGDGIKLVLVPAGMRVSMEVVEHPSPEAEALATANCGWMAEERQGVAG